MTRRSRSTLFIVLLPLLSAGLIILFRAGSTPAPATAAPSAFRIISLSPAITDILIDLDLAPFIVARDRYDRQLPAGLPRVGDLTQLDVETVINLGPSDILFQAGNQGLPPRLSQLAADRGWNICNEQIDSLADLRRVFVELPGRLTFVNNPDARENALRRARDLDVELSAALAPLPVDLTAGLGPILFLYSVDALGAFGPGSYMSDAAASMGLVNALADGPAWRTLDVELLLSLDPFAIILFRELTPGPGAENSSAWRAASPADVGPLGDLAIEAVRAGRVFLLEHPQALLPGSSIIEVASLLRQGAATIPRRESPRSESGPD